MYDQYACTWYIPLFIVPVHLCLVHNVVGVYLVTIHLRLTSVFLLVFFTQMAEKLSTGIHIPRIYTPYTGIQDTTHMCIDDTP